MTLDEFKKQQNKSLKAFERLMKTDPEQARKKAHDDLYGAKIIDKRGNLMKQYR